MTVRHWTIGFRLFEGTVMLLQSFYEFFFVFVASFYFPLYHLLFLYVRAVMHSGFESDF